MKTGLKVVRQTLLKTRSLKNRKTISQQPIIESIAKAILEDYPIIEKSVKTFLGENRSVKMSVKDILMKDRSMVKSTCTILGRLGHSYPPLKTVQNSQ